MAKRKQKRVKYKKERRRIGIGKNLRVGVSTRWFICELVCLVPLEWQTQRQWWSWCFQMMMMMFLMTLRCTEVGNEALKSAVIAVAKAKLRTETSRKYARVRGSVISKGGGVWRRGWQSYQIRSEKECCQRRSRPCQMMNYKRKRDISQWQMKLRICGRLKCCFFCFFSVHWQARDTHTHTHTH